MLVWDSLLSIRLIARFLIFSLIFILGCGSGKRDPGYLALVEQQSEVPESGELGDGDKFEIRVRNEPGLTGEYIVGSDGSITFHFIGTVPVLGKTCREVETLIIDGLKTEYIKNPSVLCTITEYNSKRVLLLGEVKKPGSFPYRANITIVEAMALAGGFSDRASANNTKLSRTINGVEVQVLVPVQDIVEGLGRNIKLLPGDIVFVPKVAF